MKAIPYPNTEVPQRVVKRFWSKVNKDGPIQPHCPELGKCWEWMAGCFEQGYGAFGFDRRTQKAHRISWLITTGSLPDGMFVLHKCDNTKCVNPSHLRLGTNDDNMADMVSKRRSSWGARNVSVSSPHLLNPPSKLTERQVRAIRDLAAQGDLTLKKIAPLFGINETMVGFIVRRVVWRHV